MDPELQELLARIGELTDEELADLESRLLEEFENVEGAEPTDETIELMSELADAIDQVRGENEGRETAREERRARAEEIRQRVRNQQDEGEEEEPEEPEDEATEGDDSEPAGETEDEAEQPEAVAAAATPAPRPRPAATRVAPRRPRAHAPVPARQPQVTITAAGDVPGYSAGQPFLELEDVGRAFADRMEAFRGSKGPSSNVPVARFHFNYPEDRVLRGQTQQVVNDRIEAVVSPQAIVAAGGLCAPVAVDYSLAMVSTTARPVRDSLATFDAGRGGVKFIRPPVLTDVANAVDIWTEENDTNPSNPATKPCLTITCGTEVEEVVDAITQCLQVGNFSRRTFPEQFAAWWSLAAAEHAREAERELLRSIGAGSTAVTTGRVLGAARDMLDNVDQVTSQMRNRHRMAPAAPIRVIFPQWLRSMIRSDLARELPGATAERLAVADAQIDAFFAVRNVNITWALEGEIGQDYSAQGAGALHPWKSQVIWYAFPEGSWLFLDGGTLDFGVNIVDTTMISLNNSRAFLETFEGSAFRGVESLRITSAVCPDGSTSATIDIDPCTTGS